MHAMHGADWLFLPFVRHHAFDFISFRPVCQPAAGFKSVEAHVLRMAETPHAPSEEGGSSNVWWGKGVKLMTKLPLKAIQSLSKDPEISPPLK